MVYGGSDPLVLTGFHGSLCARLTADIVFVAPSMFVPHKISLELCLKSVLQSASEQHLVICVHCMILAGVLETLRQCIFLAELADHNLSNAVSSYKTLQLLLGREVWVPRTL